MNYPTELPISFLERSSPRNKTLTPIWKRINALLEGGHVLESQKQDFLPKRAGEEDFLYQTRISKFTYRNLLSSAIQGQVAKLSAASYSIAGTEDKFWQSFRENVDLKGTSEPDFIARLFRSLLSDGIIYAQIDKPKTAYQPRNRLEQEQMGIRPYVLFHSPATVLDEELDQFGRLQFLKIRQVSEYRPTPLRAPIDQVEWTILTSTEIIKARALVKLSPQGAIVSILDGQGREVPVSDETKIPLDKPIQHGMGQVPIVRFELPSDLWVADQARLKCEEHLNLDNCKYDSATIGAYIQRTYEPITTPIDAISDFDDQPLQSGNPYILKGSFEFKEMTGSSLTVLQSILESLEKEIRSIVASGGASITQEQLVQSGVSKRFDTLRESLLMLAYGRLIISAYQQILKLVAQAQGLDPNISMTGFTSFEVDSADELILEGQELQKIRSLLPPSVLKLFSKTLSAAIVPNASAEERATIEAEIDQLNFDQPAPQIQQQPQQTA